MGLIFYDAAYPMTNPPSTDGVCGYIGGDTFHVWTVSEWHAQKARYRLPIFVRSNPPGPGAAADVATARMQLTAIGCPAGSLVAWDMETAADPGYISEVYTLLKDDGYKLIVYGSQSTVAGNKSPDGLYWGADWTNIEHIHSGDVITQYRSFADYDLEESETGLPFWDTHPTPVDPPNDPPPSVTYIPAADVEAIMGSLPILQRGSDDKNLSHQYVRRVQALVYYIYGEKVTDANGVFGASTQSAVKAVQKAAKLTQDGIVGPNTWSVLVTGKA